MSRSGYVDDGENIAMWRGAVNSAIRGKRGQQLLRELADGMDAMSEKVLIAEELEQDGAYCALGVVGAKRGIDMKGIDPEESDVVASKFNIANALAREITYINDENGTVWVGNKIREETPSERWTRVRKWVADNLKAPA